jgi:2-hydroxycyclohexanecarboxyl-CoA dehydrogenase
MARTAKSQISFAGKVVAITGGARGIGRATAEEFLAHGAKVALGDLDAELAAKAAAELGARPGAVVVGLPLNVGDRASFAQFLDEVEAELGPIDVLVNNAGWDRFQNFLETQPREWEQLLDINLRGPLNMHHIVVPGMLARGGGRVVNIASDAARVGSSGESVYSACKGGIISFSKTLARELARKGVTVNVVCPGPTDTPILRGFTGEGEAGQKVYDALVRAIPMKRVGQPQDIPGVVAFLASDEAAFITGQVISVSGGLTMAG